MKRFTFILLIFVLIVTLVACSNNENNKSTEPAMPTENTTPTVQETLSPEEQKELDDEKAVGNMVEAVLISIQDQNTYDEILKYACAGNVSCYIDKESEANIYQDRLVYQASGNDYGESYAYDAKYRLPDEEVFYTGGNMFGVTLTLQFKEMEDSAVCKLEDIVLNKFIRPDNAEYLNNDNKLLATERTADELKYNSETLPNYETAGLLSSMSDENLLYKQLVATCGDTLVLKSDKYHNSEYTIFIMLPAGENSLNVYGQWNGSYLTIDQQ